MDFSDLDGHIHNVVNTRRPERSSSLCANPKTSEFLFIIIIIIIIIIHFRRTKKPKHSSSSARRSAQLLN